MNWHPHMEFQYTNTSYPYNSAGSFMEYFEGLTYEHVNFIFAGASHAQENVYPTINPSFYKFGLSETGGATYFDIGHAYVINDHESRMCEYGRHLENSSTRANGHTRAVNNEWEGNANTGIRDNPVECPRRPHDAPDYQVCSFLDGYLDLNKVVWQDSIDPDSMSYEELLELGETVGTHNRGLSQELISKLPVSKYKCGFFSRKKSRGERCVICQMEYKRGDRQITLPCKHAYHNGCGSKWLSINKACPICYIEVFAADASKPVRG